MNQTCYRVAPPEKSGSVPRFAYWAYLERANTRDANIEPGLLPAKRCFAPLMQKPADAEASGDPSSQPGGSDGGTGLGGPSLGDVPGPAREQAAPERAPQRTTRLREPGILGTAIDIIA